ncbi:MAG TPA: hypothetical protein VFH83_01195 [Spirochaetia bacterium]|nr:hypothetical protein [Spirochaetia bacterium]
MTKKRVSASDVRPSDGAHLLLSTVTLLAALAFAVFFQMSKQPPFREINPFGVDPYDAVGSIAFQVTLVLALLSFARSVRLRMDGPRPGVDGFPRAILRGVRLAVLAILVTLITDCIAVLVNPVPRSRWGDLLLGQLAVLVLVVCGLLVWLAFAMARAPAAVPSSLTPADAIDDLWSLVRALSALAVGSSRRRSVDPLVSDRLFSRLPWIDPRRHPWRFTTLVGLLAGLLGWLGHLREGPPPSLSAGLLVAVISLGVETALAVVALAIVGGYLGLRPSFARGVRRRVP